MLRYTLFASALAVAMSTSPTAIQAQQMGGNVGL